MGLCASKTNDPPAANTTGGSGTSASTGTGTAGQQQGKGDPASLSLGSLGPVPIGGRDQSFPSVIGPPSLRKAPSHQAVISMTNLLNGKCRFAGTVTEEDNKDVPIAGADGDYREPLAGAAPGPDGAKPAPTLQLTVKGRQKWRVTVTLGVSLNPKPAEVDGEETIPITAELASEASANANPNPDGTVAAEYRMSSLDVDVHSMGSLRLVEEVHLRFVHLSDATRTIVCTGSISWRLHDEPKPAAVAAVPAADAAAAAPVAAAPAGAGADAAVAVPVVVVAEVVPVVPVAVAASA